MTGVLSVAVMVGRESKAWMLGMRALAAARCKHNNSELCVGLTECCCSTRLHRCSRRAPLPPTLLLLSRHCQVLWSYGRRGNDDFFCYHGFVLGSNPDEDVVLFADMAGLVGWALQELQELSGLREQQSEQQLVALAGGDRACLWAWCDLWAWEV